MFSTEAIAKERNETHKTDLRKLVQIPELGPIRNDDLKWHSIGSKVGPESKKEAVLFFDRAKDFIDGQILSGVCNFTKGTSIKSKVLAQPRINSYLIFQLYECEYGPEDFTNGKEGGHQGEDFYLLTGLGVRL
jgi:hypothetical protein